MSIKCDTVWGLRVTWGCETLMSSKKKSWNDTHTSLKCKEREVKIPRLTWSDAGIRHQRNNEFGISLDIIWRTIWMSFECRANRWRSTNRRNKGVSGRFFFPLHVVSEVKTQNRILHFICFFTQLQTEPSALRTDSCSCLHSEPGHPESFSCLSQSMSTPRAHSLKSRFLFQVPSVSDRILSALR